MSDTPTSTEEISDAKPLLLSDNFLVSFHYSGTDNGMEKSGFDSRVVTIPKDLIIQSSKEIKDIAEAMAAALFQDGKKYVGLTITLINVLKLPL